MNTPSNEQDRTVKARFQTARELLGSGTVERAELAIAELTPALGRTCGISEFQTLADLLCNAYTITRNQPLALAWRQYAPPQSTNKTRVSTESRSFPLYP